MELPIEVAFDTTENWNKSDIALGESELAIELFTRPNGTQVKHLLVGDGKQVGPNVGRLRAPPEFIAGLPEYLAAVFSEQIAIEAEIRRQIDESLSQSIKNEAFIREEADKGLRQAIAALAPEGLDDIPAMIEEEKKERKLADEILQQAIKAIEVAIIADDSESDTLPAADADVDIWDVLQKTRNNLKYLFNKKVNRVVGKAEFYFCELSEDEMAVNRLLKPSFQLIEIALYPELCAKMYCGDSKNATAPWWYKCNESGTVRSTDGTHMRVCSPEGLFPRIAGQNKVYGVKGLLANNIADNTPYDGGAVGEHKGDAARNATGKITTSGAGNGISMGGLGTSEGAFISEGAIQNAYSFDYQAPGYSGAKFALSNLGNSYPIANEFRPASYAVGVYIAY